MTNLERLKKMSLEKFASFMTSETMLDWDQVSLSYKWKGFDGYVKTREEAFYSWLKWLKEESL